MLIAAVNVYAAACLVDRPVIDLVVGHTMSGVLLVHDYRANRLLALGNVGMMVHAIGEATATRVTLRSAIDLERLVQEIPPVTYGIASFALLGLLWKLLKVKSVGAPDIGDVNTVQTVLTAALTSIIANPSRGPESRPGASLRSASSKVHKRLRKQRNAQLEGA